VLFIAVILFVRKPKTALNQIENVTLRVARVVV